MRRVLHVSRAGFYAWLGRPKLERVRRDQQRRHSILGYVSPAEREVEFERLAASGDCLPRRGKHTTSP